MNVSFAYLDYSQIYFSCVARKDIPPVRAGKFVQLANGRKEYVVLSPKQLSTYHANIVERFFHRQDVPGEYNAARDSTRSSTPRGECSAAATGR